jgi:hypothetical protein
MAARSSRPKGNRNIHRQQTRRRRFLQHRQREQRLALGSSENDVRTWESERARGLSTAQPAHRRET